MSDQNEPPKRHVRMRQGRARKAASELLEQRETDRIIASASEAAKDQALMEESKPIHVQTESTVPQLNSVLQVIKGPHRGRLCQVGRIDRDTFHCFIVTRDNGRDFIDVKPDEYILVAHSKKGMTGLKEPLDAQSVTPQVTEDSPFAGFKGIS